MRFLVVNGVVVLGTLAFCSCLSPLTSWAGTTLGSEYRAEMHVTHNFASEKDAHCPPDCGRGQSRIQNSRSQAT